tara:strand:+ start:1852 stop:2202 length:351 start_codon:yes stop_codon:yes gene_type:complete
MDWSAAKFFLDLVALAAAAGAWLYARSVKKAQAGKGEIAALTKEVMTLDKRLDRAEARLEDSPTSKAIHELALSVTEFSGDLKAITARMDGMGHIVDRLEAVAARQEDYIMRINKP